MPSAFISAVEMPMPDYEKGAGGRQKYNFKDLPVGKSIVVLDKTKKQLTTTISTENAKEYPVLDKDGKEVFETEYERDGNGDPIMQPVIVDGKAVMEKGKPKMAPKIVTNEDGTPKMVKKVEKRLYFAMDCDPATDPEKALCRIWRKS